MMNGKGFILIVVGILASCLVFGQEGYTGFYDQSLKTNNTGMMVLGSWAVANIATGAVGWARGSGENKYFHQMNVMWNVVNLGIAGIALFNNYRMDLSGLGDMELLDKHIKSEHLFLINAGLDVLYIGTGALLRGLSHKSAKRQDLMNGYGSSLILQGSFLLIFDAAMWGIQHAHRLQFLEKNNIELSLGLNQMALSWSF